MSATEDEVILEQSPLANDSASTVVAAVNNYAAAKKNTERATLLTCVWAIASDKSHRKHGRALVFVDTGSQRSFITESLAPKLNLPFYQTESLNLMAFGTQRIRPYKSMRTEINLRKTDGAWETFKVSTVQHITHNVPHAPSHLLKAQLIEAFAALPSITSGDQEILIGMDQLSKIMEISPSRPMRSGFSIYQTKLGPVIAGRRQVSHYGTSIVRD
ncbi:hypothetical protein Tcan_01868 [Toxocara canis]|uniref:DUF1758 domain-containing protein n=1 Tax=Toxocara canis TaxID=6265 RepID=A0A0B2UY27_TOXCA|nr:hypothetical protein Tcan_01868 [Toxocara canis]